VLHELGREAPELPKNLAVIGAGIAGLSAAWLTSRRHNVTLYEAEARLGGHANTVTVETGIGPIDVDTGFIVFNSGNYPNFEALLDYLDVNSIAAEMSFSASIGGGDFEYASTFGGLLAQPGNLFSRDYWRMIAEIVKFYRQAEGLIDSPKLDGVTLGEFLDREGYSQALIDRHILPMSAAIWSCPAETIRSFPMRAFVRFFSNHRLFRIGAPTYWRTVRGGSRTYVEALTTDMRGPFRRRTAVRSVARTASGVMVVDADGRREFFDDVILATHADVTLALLSDASDEERRLLGAFRYTDNRAVLHEDEALMPKRRRAWACWNYLDTGALANGTDLCVTYWMNALQSLDRRQNLFLTLNPVREPRDSAIKREFHYTHPVFDQAALDAQHELWRLQGKRSTWFAGAYFGYGFHEDGLQSGLAVAEKFGVRRPWTIKNESGRLAPEPRLAIEAA